ncbi:KPN_02809 family neutral zinc metallopeptidase [Novosphingopyxis sp. YJ-S2-01]|uniref:KPN_02809 family neutral zinc metallopeptidase n=1 Tax=Novosphingopyxis sp. YJ-S2-01 TaxID=2794021 RepID=UPI0018DE43C9|nr:neutral zinc metallopeptidase [Novosphingopyxis sp. YJ-S2-01]MBH9537475.1 neutral zinc metallopeptidase [Novosphingopyxis sp. YJ-S2-01]
MRLDDYDNDIQVSDQRGQSFGGGGGLGGLLGFLPLLMGRKLGCGTIVLIAIVGFFIFSSGGLQLGGGGGGSAGSAQRGGTSLESSCNIDAVSKEACNTLSSLDNTWEQVLPGFRQPTLVFYSQRGQSGCGAAQSAMGPFYCPTDQGIYLDTDFFRQLDQQMGAGGDFARRYVIAHEMGHHIQKLTGVADEVRQRQARASQEEGNALQVRMELQADCYAGVWAGQNRDRLEPGDIEEGMTAAHAIGDDTLMKEAGRRPVESMFTHGTSEQRMRWLQRGLQSGDPQQCDTFAARSL